MKDLKKVDVEWNDVLNFIDECIAILYSKGHCHCLEYGYSFAKVCLKTIEKEYKMQIAGVAMGVGLLFSKKSISDFLE